VLLAHKTVHIYIYIYIYLYIYIYKYTCMHVLSVVGAQDSAYLYIYI